MAEKISCEKCKKQVLAAKRIYSRLHPGYLCVACYHDQFQKLPSQPKPLLFKEPH